MPLFIKDDSSFLIADINSGNNDLNEVLMSFRQLLQTNQLNTFGQYVLTESDIKCILYKNLVPIIDGGNNCNIFTEVPDRPDRRTNRRRVIRTDLTIGHEVVLTYGNTDINKSFTLIGDFIDIELKFIRNDFDFTGNKNVMIKDMDKLTKLINKGYVPNQGQTLFGLAIFGFKTEDIMNQYLNDTEFMNRVNRFTTPRGNNSLCRKVLFLYDVIPTT